MLLVQVTYPVLVAGSYPLRRVLAGGTWQWQTKTHCCHLNGARYVQDWNGRRLETAYLCAGIPSHLLLRHSTCLINGQFFFLAQGWLSALADVSAVLKSS